MRKMEFETSMKKVYLPQSLWGSDPPPDAEKIGEQKRGFRFTLVPEDAPDHAYKVRYTFVAHRWCVTYYYRSEQGGYLMFDEQEHDELVEAAGTSPFYQQLELDFGDEGMPVFRCFPNSPTPVCECGATKMGVSAQQPYHSSWCPVKSFVPPSQSSD